VTYDPEYAMLLREKATLVERAARPGYTVGAVTEAPVAMQAIALRRGRVGEQQYMQATFHGGYGASYGGYGMPGYQAGYGSFRRPY
jgi:hypothetical protein